MALRAAVAAACGATAATAMSVRSAAGSISVVESSEAGAQWAQLPALNWGNDFPSYVDVSVDTSRHLQSILGFGSAMTDTSAYNAMVWMSNETRAQFFEAMWGASGLGLTIGRVHINSPDYAFQSYNMDNVTDDFALQYFDSNLTYDSQRVLPMIRGAKAAALAGWGDDIRLFASPWSPPGWMKQNNNMIDSDLPCLKNDTAKGSYKQAWADYIVKWLQAFEAHGLPMWGLTPQNEPGAQQKVFESCAYRPSDMAEFVGTYLGPALQASFPNLTVMAFDHNKLAALDWAAALWSNATVAQYLTGFALHWYDYDRSLGLENVEAINALLPDYPNKTLLATEACYLQSLQYNWSTSELYIADVIGDLNFGVQGWTMWNSVLYTGDKYPQYVGGPNHDQSRVFGDPLLFEWNITTGQQLLKQPSYYILGHFSRFARPGSFRVRSGGAGVASLAADYDAVRAAALGQAPYSTLSQLLAVAFVSHDSETAVVVVANPTDAPITFKLRDLAAPGSGAAARAVQDTIPAHAIRTYTYAVSA